jgi:hypothetical protein
MAAGNTYDAIATQTLGSAVASVTFSSIPATYTDLVLVYNGKFASANGQIALQFNGDTATNYSSTEIFGNGSTAGSSRDPNATSMRLGYTLTANIENMNIMQIMNYSNATTYKTVMARQNTAGSASGAAAHVGLWRNTAAINSIVVACYNSLNFVSGSTFTLYGIASA